MKNKTFTCIGILILFLAMTGCSRSVAKLAVDTKETTVIDATAKIDPYDYLEDVDEEASVEYSIADNIMTITVSKDNKTETFEVPVEIEEPNVSIDENITIDTYVGYDIEDYIHEDEGVSHTTNFDEETGDLSVTFTKGEWTTTLESKVEITDSDPIYGKYTSTFVCNTLVVKVGEVELYNDGTCYDKMHNEHGVWSTNGENMTVTNCGMPYDDITLTGNISDDKKTITFFEPNDCYPTMGSAPIGYTTTFVSTED